MTAPWVEAIRRILACLAVGSLAACSLPEVESPVPPPVFEARHSAVLRQAPIPAEPQPAAARAVDLRGVLELDPKTRQLVGAEPLLVSLSPVPSDPAPDRPEPRRLDCPQGLRGHGLVVLPVGGRLLLRNRDRIQHRFFHAGRARLAPAPGGEGLPAFVPQGVGVQRLFCHLHAGEHLDVYVVPPGRHVQLGRDGRFVFPQTPPGAYRLSVLHPRLGWRAMRLRIPSAGLPLQRLRLTDLEARPAGR